MKPRGDNSTDEEKINAYLLKANDWLALLEAGQKKLSHDDNITCMSEIIETMSLIEDKVSADKKNIWLRCLIKACWHRGQSYLYMSMNEEALEDFEMLQKLMPQQDQDVINLIATTHFNIGFVLFREKSYSGALDEFLLADKFTPDEATKNLKAEIKLMIEQCGFKVHGKGFSGQPKKGVHRPTPQRAQPTEPPQKSAATNVEIGQPFSAFSKHQARSRSPSPRSSEPKKSGSRPGSGKK